MNTLTAATAMRQARTALMITAPFYGSLAMNLKLVETAKVRTAAVDGERLFYNPDYVMTLRKGQRVYLFAHEGAHCANLHHTRRGDRDPIGWNVATDHVINLDLIRSKVGEPIPGILADPQFAGMSAEKVFAILFPPKGPQDQDQGDDDQGGEEGEDEQQASGSGAGDEEGDKGQDEGDQDQGNGEGDGDEEGEQGGEGGASDGEGTPEPGPSCGDPGGCGEVLDAAETPAEMQAAEDKWQTITRQALAVASRDAGTLSGDLERLAQELNRQRQNWREVLYRFIDQSQRFDYSWTTPDRRFGGAPYILPGIVSDGVRHVAIGIDISGSTMSLFDAFVDELRYLIGTGIVDKFSIVFCDTAITQIIEATSPEDFMDIKATGWGGTSYKPVWKWLAEQVDEPVAALVYFTDMMPNDGFGEDPQVPVLWAASGSPQYWEPHPFGELIELA